MGGPGQLQVVPRLAIGPITGGDEMPATIQLGATGVDVKRLQRVLGRAMLISALGPVNGTFDDALDAAVRRYQQSEGIVVDGIVGPVTWSHLPLTPGTAQQLTLERACGLLERLGP